MVSRGRANSWVVRFVLVGRGAGPWELVYLLLLCCCGVWEER